MNRLPGLLGFLVSLLLLAGTTAVEAQGKKKSLNPVGEPRGFKPGEPFRYAVWLDQHGWHLYTTTDKKKHTFKGQIEVIGGVIESIRGHHLEASGRTADHWKVDSNRRVLKFDFDTDGAVDGIVFRVSPLAKEIRFKLHIDGKEAPARVFVGREGHHPGDIPFTLPAHPGKK